MDEMTKDELKALAMDKYGVKLDMRKGIDDLRAEVEALDASPEGLDSLEPEIVAPEATHVFNRANGRVFVRTVALENHLKDFFYCDKDGKPV